MTESLSTLRDGTFFDNIAHGSGKSDLSLHENFIINVTFDKEVCHYILEVIWIRSRRRLGEVGGGLCSPSTLVEYINIIYLNMSVFEP